MGLDQPVSYSVVCDTLHVYLRKRGIDESATVSGSVVLLRCLCQA